MKKLQAGDLRHKLKIRRAEKVKDGKGGWDTAWTTVAEPWAEVLGLDGREAMIDQVLQGISTYRIRIRWRAGVLPKDQVQFGELELNITSAVDPNGDREQLVIMATTASALKTS